MSFAHDHEDGIECFEGDEKLGNFPLEVCGLSWVGFIFLMDYFVRGLIDRMIGFI